MLDWGIRKDPLGHRVHWWIAWFALILQPIHVSAAAVGQGVLIAYAVLRLHATWRSLVPLLRSPVMGFSLAIVVWTLLAIAWSPDPAKGWSALRTMRFVLFVFALWPVLDRPVGLALALAVGCGVQAFCQVLVYLGWLTHADYPPGSMNGGLGKHPGYTALWSACTAMMFLGLGLVDRRRRKIALGVLAVTSVSVVLSGSRSLLIAQPLGVAAVLLTGLRSGIRWFADRRFLVVLSAIVVVVAGVLLMPGSLPRARIAKMFDEISLAVERSDLDSSSGLRLLWWRESLPIFKEAPILGHGTGSTRFEFDRRLETLFSARSGKSGSFESASAQWGRTDNLHSMIATEAVERGLVGLGLWAGLVASAMLTSWRRIGIDPLAIGMIGAWTVFCVYGIANSLQQSGITTALLGVLVCFTIPRSTIGGIEASLSST